MFNIKGLSNNLHAILKLLKIGHPTRSFNASSPKWGNFKMRPFTADEIEEILSENGYEEEDDFKITDLLAYCIRYEVVGSAEYDGEYYWHITVHGRDYETEEQVSDLYKKFLEEKKEIQSYLDDE